MLNIEKLTKEYESALGTGHLPRIVEIVRSLNREGRKSGKDALRLYERINQELFNRGIRISILDLEGFRLLFEAFAVEEKETKEPKKRFSRAISVSPIELSPKVGGESGTAEFEFHVDDTVLIGSGSEIESRDSSGTDDFIDVFVRFYNSHPEIFTKLKDFYFFFLSNQMGAGKTELLIVHDTESGNNSFLLKLRERDADLSVKYINIFKDVTKERANIEDPEANYICVLCLTPKLGDEELGVALNEFFHFFSEKRAIRVRSSQFPISRDNVDNLSVGEQEINAIQRSCNKVFSNRNLTYDEQTIIKQFFGGQPGIIDYRVIAGGMSGATVIEVQFMQFNMRDSKRYVIKIAKRDQEKSNNLELEHEKFQDMVDLLPVSTTAYSARYEKTDVLEAIRYNFASTDSLSDSYSFRELIDDFLGEQQTFKDFAEISGAISKLFECDIFKGWDAANPTKTSSCELLYERYLDYDGSLEKIREIINDDPATTQLVENFAVIRKFENQTKTKTCHGDLHSQNCFYDGEKVFLIDFGWTDTHPALIDHAFLEASIRFNHFPRYISTKELDDNDDAFLGMESFKEGFRKDITPREKLSSLYQLINLIRRDAPRFMHNPNSPLEYLIALLMITFRLIKYDDLHQRYAYAFATKLSIEIVKLIDSMDQQTT